MLADCLADEVTLSSPFNTWGPTGSAKACIARTLALCDWRCTPVIYGSSDAAIRRSANVGDSSGPRVSGIDWLVLNDDGAVHVVDIFIKPASALSRLHAVMSCHWPR